MKHDQKDSKFPFLPVILILLCFCHTLRPDTPKPVTAGLTLLPAPSQTVTRSDRFRVSRSFRVQIKGFRSDRIAGAVGRIISRLSERTGMVFGIPGLQISDTARTGSLLLECRRAGKLEIHEDESYRLKVMSERIRLSAETDIGVLRGIETLLQLLSSDEEGYYFQGAEIKDQPRFTWRGLLIDSCRHFIPIEVIKRNLDGMCLVKLNVFHWHLTEDQGFRIECLTYPRLHELGSDGLYYTRDQIREVIAYASDRGIRVVPEFDIPGHSTSWLVGYPELASAPGPYAIERKFGIFDPCFNPALEETYRFFDRFFKEMAELFPDEYIHIGGDEVNGNHWDANPVIQAFKKENRIDDNHHLQAYFNRRIAGIIARYGKKIAGWEQILHSGLPEGTVIQSYLGEKSLIEAARKGYLIVNSKANELYIDLMFPTDFHYLYDPLPPHLPLNNQEKKRVLGSEATMWGELVSPETIDSRIWPRAAAIAERFWSPGHVRNISDMYRRLDAISLQLEALELTHLKNRDMMIRRLLQGRNIEPLERLVEVIEPIILYDRPDWRERYTQQLPLTRVVDIAVPDARAARIFRGRTEIFLKNRDPVLKTELQKRLMVWKENHRKLEPLIRRFPILKEIEGLSSALSKTAGIALKAMQAISGKGPLNPQWKERSLRYLEEAGKPQGDCRLRIVSAVENLLKTIKK
jgi:hexosaminidase